MPYGIDRDRARAARRAGRRAAASSRRACWSPTAIITAAGCPIRSASASTSTATAPTIALPDCGRTLHVIAPGAVLSPHRDRWRGFFFARESERGLNPHRRLPLRASTRASRSRPATHGGSWYGLEPDGDAAPAIVDAAARARCGVGAAGEPNPLRAAVGASPPTHSWSSPRQAARAHDDRRRLSVVQRLGARHDDRAAGLAASPTGASTWPRRSCAASHRSSTAGCCPTCFPTPAAPGIQHGRRGAVVRRQRFAPARGDGRARSSRATVSACCARSSHGYSSGTRYGIGVDPADGLLRAGVAGRAADLDGRQSRRPRRHAAHRQAGRDQRAVVRGATRGRRACRLLRRRPQPTEARPRACASRFRRASGTTSAAAVRRPRRSRRRRSGDPPQSALRGRARAGTARRRTRRARSSTSARASC